MVKYVGCMIRVNCLLATELCRRLEAIGTAHASMWSTLTQATVPHVEKRPIFLSKVLGLAASGLEALINARPYS
eukprot:8667692-Pyramimonas_sp.AAC.1